MPIRAAPEALAAANRGSTWSERDRHHLRHRVHVCPRARLLCDLPPVRLPGHGRCRAGVDKFGAVVAGRPFVPLLAAALGFVLVEL